jgi:uncharacterized protein YegJ (DUF2314 family)
MPLWLIQISKNGTKITGKKAKVQQCNSATVPKSRIGAVSRQSKPIQPKSASLKTATHHSTNCIKVLTWNARSLITREKKDLARFVINKQMPEVSVITESWLEDQFHTHNSQFTGVQTNPYKSRGILIIVRKNIEWQEEQINELEG